MYLANLRKEVARTFSVLCPREPGLVSRLVSLGPSSWVAGGCSLEPWRAPRGRHRRSPLWPSGYQGSSLACSWWVGWDWGGSVCGWGLPLCCPKSTSCLPGREDMAEQRLSLLSASHPWPFCSEAHLKLLSPSQHLITCSSADLWGQDKLII